MKKILLTCFFLVLLLFIPFIFANYFLTNYYLENDRTIFDNDILVIMVLEWLSAIAVSLVIRKKNQNFVSENFDYSKKVFLVSLALFVLLGLFILLDGYAEIFGEISWSLGIFDEWPLALAVTWERYLDGTFFLCVLMCITICFFRKEYFIHKKNTTTK